MYERAEAGKFMFNAGRTFQRVPGTNGEWGGAEAVSQVRWTGSQSQSILDSSEQTTRAAGDRKPFAGLNQNSAQPDLVYKDYVGCGVQGKFGG